MSAVGWVAAYSLSAATICFNVASWGRVRTLTPMSHSPVGPGRNGGHRPHELVRLSPPQHAGFVPQVGRPGIDSREVACHLAWDTAPATLAEQIAKPRNAMATIPAKFAEDLPSERRCGTGQDQCFHDAFYRVPRQ